MSMSPPYGGLRCRPPNLRSVNKQESGGGYLTDHLQSLLQERPEFFPL
jgi:hypothetical protein